VKQLIFSALSIFMVWLPVSPLAAATFDVTKFGATGDGQTDDLRAIQAAADAAFQAGGGIVYLPAGTYLHAGVIDFHSNTTVRGAGVTSVLLASVPGSAAIRFANAGNCAIDHVKISSPATLRLQNDTAAALLFSYSQNCTASNLWIEGAAAAGVIVHGSLDMLIDGIDVKMTKADGIHVVSGSQRVMVSNNTASNTGDDSFSAVAYGNQPQTAGVTFSNNTSNNALARGIACVGADNCLITGNTINSPAAHGIAVSWEQSYNTWHPHHAQIQNNVIHKAVTPGMNAIMLNYAADVQIGYNQVYDSTTVYLHNSSGVSVNGIALYRTPGTGLIARNCQQVTIQNTIIQQSRDSGLLLDTVSAGAVSGNNLIDVQMKGDPAKGAITVLNSSNLTGDGNAVQHTAAWNSASYGPLLVVNSTNVAIGVTLPPPAQ
jgi:parallel beta-helix repeat protein